VEELEYRVPEKLLSLLVSVKGDAHFPSGLDLGCGTGLSGAVFGQLIAEFDGIDLYAKMISLAEQRKIYHELHTGSITDYLASGAKRYDFFLACDVFVYMGDLQEVMQLLWQQGKGGAILCFSTETLAGEGFGLQKSGRFAHAPLYITQLAEKCGWRLLAHRADNLRRDRPPA
jgi:predicted TPR repeat methyltransferase